MVPPPARRARRRLLAAVVGGLTLVVPSAALSATAATTASAATYPQVRPTVAEYTQLSTSTTPPTQAQCSSAGRRCFQPQSVQAAYDVGPLYARGYNGAGMTIAIVDSYGSDTMAHDLHVFDQAFGIAAMCGEESVACAPGMPSFSELQLQGAPATVAPPSQSKGTGQENKAAWALEVSLDVETAHAMAPGANILLVTTPTAETLGVQGMPQMMAAEDYVVQHHLANVISQSFASGEGAFSSSAALQNLRYAFQDAAANGVTVLGSSGDNGSAITLKTPVKNPRTLPDPGVEWPASDPLVTGVGGTYLCTNANAAGADPRTVDSSSNPAKCQANPGQAEVGWTDGGGGYSSIFSRPAYQDTLPTGSTAIGAMRGVPDISLQASSGTGMLVYTSLPPDGNGGLNCGATACSTGWYDIGGTSLSCPQWAGLVAIADQINGGGLGQINPALYKVAANPTQYAADFNDITIGNNQTDPTVAGYSASAGWDPVTGLGTPNAALLLPDLVAAAH